MPKKANKDPEVLEARRQRSNERARLRMRKTRAQAKANAEGLINHALTRVMDLRLPYKEPVSLPERTAQAMLKAVLRKNNITLERIGKTVDQALDSTKLRGIGDQMRELPAFQERLRAADTGLRLMERAGELPADRGVLDSQIIVKMIVYGERHVTNTVTGEHKLLDAEDVTPTASTEGEEPTAA
jgi:hypothetical protein